jgi:hypothetical protein
MQPHDPEAFTGFENELSHVSGSDYMEIAQRIKLCAAGTRILYVAVDDSGRPIFAQWLVRSDDQQRLHRVTRGYFPQLGQGEALLEGAYTFVSARGQGVMTDGMGQLLVRARDAGDRKAFTYVAEDNLPSLRGCAKVGFVPDHLRLVARRFGMRRISRLPVDDARQARWSAAVKPRR